VIVAEEVVVVEGEVDGKSVRGDRSGNNVGRRDGGWNDWMVGGSWLARRTRGRRSVDVVIAIRMGVGGTKVERHKQAEKKNE